MMIERLQIWFIWLCRCPYSRGFGIQSPSVYRFVRYVINEHYPYYAYADLLNCFPVLRLIQRKLFFLYFRISNALQPSVWADFMDASQIADAGEVRASFIQRGCRKTQVVPFRSAADLLSVDKIDVARMRADIHSYEIYDALFEHMTESSLLIMEGIYRTKESKRFWEMILQDNRTGITFDLYHCGLVFFDHVREKRNYIINF